MAIDKTLIEKFLTDNPSLQESYYSARTGQNRIKPTNASSPYSELLKKLYLPIKQNEIANPEEFFNVALLLIAHTMLSKNDALEQPAPITKILKVLLYINENGQEAPLPAEIDNIFEYLERNPEIVNAAYFPLLRNTINEIATSRNTENFSSTQAINSNFISQIHAINIAREPTASMDVTTSLSQTPVKQPAQLTLGINSPGHDNNFVLTDSPSRDRAESTASTPRKSYLQVMKDLRDTHRNFSFSSTDTRASGSSQSVVSNLSSSTTIGAPSPATERQTQLTTASLADSQSSVGKSPRNSSEIASKYLPVGTSLFLDAEIENLKKRIHKVVPTYTENKALIEGFVNTIESTNDFQNFKEEVLNKIGTNGPVNEFLYESLPQLLAKYHALIKLRGTINKAGIDVGWTNIDKIIAALGLDVTVAKDLVLKPTTSKWRVYTYLNGGYNGTEHIFSQVAAIANPDLKQPMRHRIAQALSIS